MPHIIFKGIARADDPDLLAVNPKPAGARDLRLSSVAEQVLWMLPGFFLCITSMIMKARLTGRFPLLAPLLPVGVLLGILACFLHELLHALPQPKGAVVYIGFIPRGFLFFMKCKEPISRRRFVLMALLPVTLGVIPLALFWFSTSSALCALWWPMAMIGFLSPAPDYANVFHILREVPPKGRIQDAEQGLCWFV